MPETLDLAVLRRIAQHPTAPFFEDAVRQEALAILDELFGREESVNIQQDQWGNVIAHYQGDSNRKKPKAIAYVAHMDHPGFHVTGHPKTGYVDIALRGGLNKTLLGKGTKIDLCFSDGRTTRRQRGTIIGQLPDGEDGSAHYQVRAPNAHDFTFATLSLPSFRVGKDKRIRAPALDDLASIGMSIGALKQIVDEKMDVDVYVVLHRAEEVGFIGAYGVASAHLLPEDALVYSVETSSYRARRKRGDPRCPIDTLVKVGGGIVIRTGDASTPAFDFDAIHLAREAALDLNSGGVKVQQARMYGGSCEGTLYYALGYRTAGIILPLVAWHNDGTWENEDRVMAEAVHRDDFHGGTQLLVATARKLQQRPELCRELGTGDRTPEQKELVAKVKTMFEGYVASGMLERA